MDPEWTSCVVLWRNYSVVAGLPSDALAFPIFSISRLHHQSFLAWTAQRSDVLTEEQRMVQGHHKSQISWSLRRYSRDDVYPQLQLQANLTSIVQAGWRPALAQHRGAQAPMIEPDVQLEKFRKDHEPLNWKRFRFNAVSSNQLSMDLAPIHQDLENDMDDQSESSSDSDTSSSSSDSEVRVPP